MHSLHQPRLSPAENNLARKSLLLASRLKHQQVCQPSDLKVCTGNYAFVSQWSPVQTKTSAANSQQWLRQAQPLHEQHAQGGSQRLCARARDRETWRYLPQPYETYKHGSKTYGGSEPDWDNIVESSGTPDMTLPARKPMQAMSMPKKKQGTGQAGPVQKFSTVRNVESGARSRIPEVPARTSSAGIGDYAKRVKAAGVVAAISVLPCQCCHLSVGSDSTERQASHAERETLLC